MIFRAGNTYYYDELRKGYDTSGLSSGVEQSLVNTTYDQSKQGVEQIYNRTDIESIQLGVPTGIEQGFDVSTFQPNEDKNLASYMKVFDWQDIFENSSSQKPIEASATSGYSNPDVGYWKQFETNKKLLLIAGVVIAGILIFKKGRK